MNNQRLYACEHCFKDNRLREWIREEGKIGDCSWCGYHGANIISIDRLGPLFRDVVYLYEESDGPRGDYIGYLLQSDWEIFSERIEEAPDDLMHNMAIEILESGLEGKEYFDYSDYRNLFYSRENSLEEELDFRITEFLENTLKKSLEKHPNIRADNDEISGLEVAFDDFITVYEEGYVFYRARIHKDRSRKEKFTLSELGAPPPKDNPAGRANRSGESVLYLSSDKQTALSEVRAWKGAAVAIASMKIRCRLLIVNLINFNFPESPFFEEDLNWKCQLSGLFYTLAKELSRPVMPHENDQLYLPSQHICDLIRESKYDGVAFPSSMGIGYNIVLFSPKNAEVYDIDYFRVKEINFRFDEFNEHDEIYEEYPYEYYI